MVTLSPSHRGQTAAPLVPARGRREATGLPLSSLSRKKRNRLSPTRRPVARSSPAPAAHQLQIGQARGWWPVARGAQLLAFAGVALVVSLYASVEVEELTRRLVNTPSTPLSFRARSILNFLGTGRLVRPLLCRMSERDKLRGDSAALGVAHRAAGLPCSLLPHLQSASRALFLAQPKAQPLIALALGTPVAALQQHQLIAGATGGAGAGAGAAAQMKDWVDLRGVVKERIPVVVVTSHIPNDPQHPALVAIKQARKLNDPVWVLGPNPQLKHLTSLGVHVESRFDYNTTFEWLQSHLGLVKIEFARLWFLHAFMHRHRLKRVFSISADVMLYANITEVVACLYPDTPVALPVRWPSMQPPPLPSQFTSTSVSTHAGLWHIKALDDYLKLYEVIIELALFGGPRGAPLGRKEYQEQIILGWYTWSRCWTDPGLDPPCMAEPSVGISGKLGSWLRKKTKYRPKYLVESLCQPRACKRSSWSEDGLCVFDNSFSVASRSKFFRFRPPGDKCPQSKLYEHFHAWMGQSPRKNVQFLAVNFQGTRRDYLKLDDPDPAKTWGSAVF